MNTADLNLQATDQNGKAASVTVQQTDVDAITVTIIDDGSSSTYKLDGLQHISNGVAQGNASVWGQRPTVRLEILQGSFEVLVGHMWFAPKPMQFLATPDNLSKAGAWLDSAGFPPA